MRKNAVMGLVWVIGAALTFAVSCTFNGGPPDQLPPQAPPGALQLGLPDDYKERAQEAYKAFPKPFQVDGATAENNRKKQILLFNAELAVEVPGKPKGKFYPVQFQQTGDCVSQGGSRAIFTTSCAQIVAGRSSSAIIPFPPYQYGISRVTEGGGRPRCGSAGAYPDDCANGFTKYGYVSQEEAGVQYSGRLADQWGCKGPPAALLEIGKKRNGGEAYPARTVDEALEALANGYALTAGIDWTPGQTQQQGGFTITRFNGRNQGGHQIALVGWDGAAAGGQAIFANSHGEDAHPNNPGDPPGSFRVDLDTFEHFMDDGTFWVYSSVPGFPANDLDLTGLNDLLRN